MMENADVARIINSDEVQSVVKAKLTAPKRHGTKKNPLTNKAAMAKLNPGSGSKRLIRKRATEAGTKENTAVKAAKKARLAASKAHNLKEKKGEETFYKKMMKAFETKSAEADTKADDAEDD